MKRFAIILTCCYLPFACLAWGVEGHRIVGQVAESYLSKKAKKEISAILGTESLAMCSNWADFVKSDPAYNYLNNWHYMNITKGLSEEQVQAFLDKDTSTDVFTKINFLAAELKNRDLPMEKRAFDLKMLVHLVGDIHQPMHTTGEGQGGNKIKVLWFNEPKNLHQMWDDQLILFQQLSYTEYVAAINHPSKEDVAALQAEPVSKWVQQSYVLADSVLADITQPDQKLEYRYNFKYVAALNRQLVTGGVHLAGLLNAIFD